MFLFLGDGSQRTEKTGDLLEITKCESHRSEADPEGVRRPQYTQTQHPEPYQPGRPLGGSDPQQPQPLLWGLVN